LLLLKQYFYIIEIGKTELTNIKPTIPPNLILSSIQLHKKRRLNDKISVFQLA